MIEIIQVQICDRCKCMTESFTWLECECGGHVEGNLCCICGSNAKIKKEIQTKKES
jgi:hypothetical protein